MLSLINIKNKNFHKPMGCCTTHPKLKIEKQDSENTSMTSVRAKGKGYKLSVVPATDR